MNIIYHKKVSRADLPARARAEIYLSCIEIIDVKSHAESLLTEIRDTSWISKLEPVGKMAFEGSVLRTLESLVEIFKSVDGTIKKAFGEYMISMSSGRCLQQKNNHTILPISELWKSRVLGNDGFDFHTVSPADRFSFGEAKYRSSGNAYGKAADQIRDFIKDGKDVSDAGNLSFFDKPIAIENLSNGKKGFVVAFSINSINYKLILENALKNESIGKLSRHCDELYIIGVKS